jgi:hypothetical protein
MRLTDSCPAPGVGHDAPSTIKALRGLAPRGDLTVPTDARHDLGWLALTAWALLIAIAYLIYLGVPTRSSGLRVAPLQRAGAGCRRRVRRAGLLDHVAPSPLGALRQYPSPAPGGRRGPATLGARPPRAEGSGPHLAAGSSAGDRRRGDAPHSRVAQPRMTTAIRLGARTSLASAMVVIPARARRALHSASRVGLRGELADIEAHQRRRDLRDLPR